MKRFFAGFFGVALLLGIGFAAFAQDASTVSLHNSFKAGDVIYMDMQIVAKGASRENSGTKPSQTPINYTMHTIADYKTDRIENGWSFLRVGFDKMMLAGEMMGGATQDLVEMLGLKDRKVELKINERGEIHELSESVQENPGMNDPVKTITRQMPYLVNLPEGPVSLGTSWEQAQEVPFTAASKPIISYTTYTLDRVETQNNEKVAVIKTLTKIDVTDVPVDSNVPKGPNANIIIRFSYKEYSITGDGEIIFSLDKGRVLSQKSSQKVHFYMQGSSDINKASFTQDVIQDFTQTIESVFSDTPPVKSEETKPLEKSAEKQPVSVPSETIKK